MADVFDAKDRSRVMARVRSTDTSPELVLRRQLHKEGFRFRLHVAALPGTPDLVLPRYHAAVFVHGCFWHQHANCSRAARPTSNQDYWNKKLARNVARDIANVESLRASGMRVAIVWECALARSRIQRTISRMAEWLQSTRPMFEIGQDR